MKKTAIFLSVALSLTNFAAVGVAEENSATPSVLYVDHVPGGMPENVMPVDKNNSPARTFATTATHNGVNFANGETWNQDAACYSPRRMMPRADVGENTGAGFVGWVYQGYIFDNTKNYVFKVRARKAAGDDVRLGVSISNENQASRAYSKEYGSKGMTLTEEYQDFATTIKMSQNFVDTKTNALTVGFPAGVKADAVVEFDTSTKQSVYLGIETAYEIKNTKISGPEILSDGTTSVFKAEVLNQLGLTGYLEQDFSWYALNSDRTEIVDDLVISPSEDTATATVEVSENAETGEYVIVAVSDEYGMAMGYDVSVKKAYYSDYIPGEMPVNMLQTYVYAEDGTRSGQSGARVFWQAGRSDGQVQVINNNQNEYWCTDAGSWSPREVYTLQETTYNNARGFRGSNIEKNIGWIEQGKTYVFSANVKKTVGEGDVYVGVSLNNGNEPSISYSKEYGSNGLLLTDQYQTMKASIKPSDRFDYTTRKPSVTFGFATGTEKDAKFAVDTSSADSVYFAEEIAYDISVERTSEEKELTYGESAEFEANVLNQLGLTGYLNQNFSWYAMNDARTEFVDGILIAENENTAKITITDDILPGKYDIVAVSDDYSIAKGYSVTVTESKEERIEKLSLKQNEDDVIMDLTVKNVDSDKIIAALGEFCGNSLVNVKMENVTIEKGFAEKKITIENVSDGNVVKAFVWNNNLKPISNTLGFRQELLVSSLNELYGSELDSAEFSDLEITEFYNNKKAAVSVTFDDGIYSAAEYYNSLFEQYNIHATAMLVSDWVKETEIPKWQALFDDGYIDLANHSKSHSIKYKTDNSSAEVLAEDITGGYNALKEMFPNEEIIAFAAPWTQKTDASTAETKKKHYANRGGGSGFVSSNPTEDVLMNLPGFVVENTHTAELLNGKIDTAIANKQWFIHLMHGVGTGTYNIDKDVCAAHFAYIGSKSDDVWAGSLNEVVKYIYEKQNATVEYEWIREEAMSVSLGDSLDDKIFNFPLTVKVEVPQGWENIVVTQNEKSVAVVAVTEENKNYVYFNAIPDCGNILLECK